MRPDLRSRRPTRIPTNPSTRSNRPPPTHGRTENIALEVAAAVPAAGTVSAIAPAPRMGALVPPGAPVTLAMSVAGGRVLVAWAAFARAVAAPPGFGGSGVAKAGAVAAASVPAADPVGVGLLSTSAALPAAFGVDEGGTGWVACNVGVASAAPVAPTAVGVMLPGVGVAGAVVRVGFGVLVTPGVGDTLMAVGADVLVGVAVGVALCPTLRFSAVTSWVLNSVLLCHGPPGEAHSAFTPLI